MVISSPDFCAGDIHLSSVGASGADIGFTSPVVWMGAGLE